MKFPLLSKKLHAQLISQLELDLHILISVVFEPHADYLIYPNSPLDWEDARGTCLDEGRNHVSIHSADENAEFFEQSALVKVQLLGPSYMLYASFFSIVFEPHTDYLIYPNSTLDWEDARATCIDEGRDLVSIHSAEENAEFSEQSAFKEIDSSVDQHVWIGGRRISGTAVRH